MEMNLTGMDVEELESMRRMYTSRRQNLGIEAQYPFDPAFAWDKEIDRLSVCSEATSAMNPAHVLPYDGNMRCINCHRRLSIF